MATAQSKTPLSLASSAAATRPVLRTNVPGLAAKVNKRAKMMRADSGYNKMSAKERFGEAHRIEVTAHVTDITRALRKIFRFEFFQYLFSDHVVRFIRYASDGTQHTWRQAVGDLEASDFLGSGLVETLMATFDGKGIGIEIPKESPHALVCECEVYFPDAGMDYCELAKLLLPYLHEEVRAAALVGRLSRKRDLRVKLSNTDQIETVLYAAQVAEDSHVALQEETLVHVWMTFDEYAQHNVDFPRIRYRTIDMKRDPEARPNTPERRVEKKKTMSKAERASYQRQLAISTLVAATDRWEDDSPPMSDSDEGIYAQSGAINVLAVVGAATVARGVFRLAKGAITQVAGARRVVTRLQQLPDILRTFGRHVFSAATVIMAFNSLAKLVGEHFDSKTIAVLVVAALSAVSITRVLSPHMHAAVGAIGRLLGLGDSDVIRLTEWDPGHPDIQAQSGTMVFDTDAALHMMARYCAVGQLGKPGPLAERVARAAKVSVSTKRAFEEERGLLVFFIELFVSAFNAVSGVVGGPQLEALATTTEMVKAWVSEACQVLPRVEGPHRRLDVQAVTAIKSLYSRAEAMTTTLRLERDEQHLVNQYKARMLTFLNSAAVAAIVVAGERRQPEGVLLRSQPGLGKTTAMHTICKGLHAELSVVQPPNMAMAMYHPSEDKWDDGYIGQTVYVMDDFLQAVMNRGQTPSEVAKIIKLINPESYNMQMAFESGKGKTFMQSPCVFATTNVVDCVPIIANLVNDVGAIGRRFNHIYDFDVVNDYKLANGQLDVAKVREFTEVVCGGNAIKALEIFRLKPTDLSGQPRAGQHYNGREFFHMLLERVKIAATPPTSNDYCYVDDGTPVISEAQSGWHYRPLARGDGKHDLIETRVRAVVAHVREHAGRYALGVMFGAAVLTGLLEKIVRVIGGVLKTGVDLLFGRGVVSAQDGKAASATPTPQEGVMRLLYRNQLEVWINANGGPVHVGYGLVVRGQYVLVPYHIVKALNARGGRITTKGLGDHRLPVDIAFQPNAVELVSEDQTSDLSLISVPGVWGKDIVKHFATSDKYGAAVRAGEVAIYRRSAGAECVMMYRCEPKHRTFDVVTQTTWDPAAEEAVVSLRRQGYEVLATGVKGDCGLPWVSVAANAHCVLGLHIAGSPKDRTSYFNRITREMLEAMLPREGVAEIVPLRVEPKEFDAVLSPDYVILANGKSVQTSTSTSKVKSPLVRAEEVRTTLGETLPTGAIVPWHSGKGLQPAWLRPFKKPPVCPMRNNLIKIAGKEAKRVDSSKLLSAIKVAMKPFRDAAKDRPRGVLPTHVAVFGDGVGFEPIASDKSPGYLLKAMGVNDRRDVIDFENKRISPEFMARLTSLEDLMAAGNRVIFPYLDFLKDEVRPIAKVEEGKSRLISASCLEYVILWRKYFGLFTKAVMETRITSGMALGLNPITEAQSVLNHFTRIEDGGFLAGDFSGFDISQQAQVTTAILSYQRHWLDPTGEDTRSDMIRRMLSKELVASVHVNGFRDGLATASKDTLYAWSMSMPSGHPATTVVNCMYNLIAFAYAFAELCPGVDMHAHLALLVYGDDNVIKVDRRVASRFTQGAIASVLEEHLGLIYTDENKEGVQDSLRSVEDVSFLKRRFVVTELGPVMALDRGSIDKALTWSSKQDTFAQTLQNVVLELALHPHDVWRDYVSSIRYFIGDEYHDFEATPDAESQRYYLRKAMEKKFDYN